MADRKFLLSKEELQNEYRELGSAEKVANKYGVCKKTVLVWMKNYGISRVNGNKPRSLMFKDIVSVLSLKPKNSIEASKMLGVSQVTTNAICRDMGLPGLFDGYHIGYAVTRYGYAVIHTGGGRKKPLHRKILEDEGYDLKGKVVHHKDGNKLNNSFSNLTTMTLSDHTKLHNRNGDVGWGRANKEATL